MTGIPEKALFPSVTVYSKNLSSQCNLPAQIEQVQDKNKYEAWSVVKIIILIHASDKGSNLSKLQGSPHLVKTGLLDFSLIWLKGKVREILKDFGKTSKMLTFPSLLLHVSLPITKQMFWITILKRMQSTSFE